METRSRPSALALPLNKAENVKHRFWLKPMEMEGYTFFEVSFKPHGLPFVPVALLRSDNVLIVRREYGLRKTDCDSVLHALDVLAEEMFYGEHPHLLMEHGEPMARFTPQA
jgi:hypothetical protein